jgi:hypothetical protein
MINITWRKVDWTTNKCHIKIIIINGLCTKKCILFDEERPSLDLSDSHFSIIGQELSCAAITISSMCKAFEIPYLQ